MACPFLDKLPAELRKQIYEYVLDFQDAPLQHATQLQPFIEKLTGIEGKLPFGLRFRERQARGSHEDMKQAFCREPFLPQIPIDCTVLLASKFKYTEAIGAFYEKNIIRVDMELFKLTSVAHLISPTGSDLSLARRLVVTFNSSYEKPTDPSRANNTIYLESFFRQAQALFPRLQEVIVWIDGGTRPSTSLFDIAEDCHSCPSAHDVVFDTVGSFTATVFGSVKLRVEFNKLADIWQKIISMAEELVDDSDEEGVAWEKLYSTVPSWARRVVLVFVEKKAVTHGLAEDDSPMLARASLYHKPALVRYRKDVHPWCPSQDACGPDSLEYWTWRLNSYWAYQFSGPQPAYHIPL